MVPALVFGPQVPHPDAGRDRHPDAILIGRLQMRRVAGEAEEERLFGAELRPFEGVRNPFSVARKFHFALQLDFAADAAREILMQLPREVAI